MRSSPPRRPSPAPAARNVALLIALRTTTLHHVRVASMTMGIDIRSCRATCRAARGSSDRRRQSRPARPRDAGDERWSHSREDTTPPRHRAAWRGSGHPASMVWRVMAGVRPATTRRQSGSPGGSRYDCAGKVRPDSRGGQLAGDVACDRKRGTSASCLDLSHRRCDADTFGFCALPAAAGVARKADESDPLAEEKKGLGRLSVRQTMSRETVHWVPRTACRARNQLEEFCACARRSGSRGIALVSRTILFSTRASPCTSGGFEKTATPSGLMLLADGLGIGWYPLRIWSRRARSRPSWGSLSR